LSHFGFFRCQIRNFGTGEVSKELILAISNELAVKRNIAGAVGVAKILNQFWLYGLGKRVPKTCVLQGGFDIK
jgi:hypothetical protein